MTIRSKDPIAVPQLGGASANLFRVSGYSYHVYEQAGYYLAHLDVSCHAALITELPYTPPPTDEDIKALASAVEEAHGPEEAEIAEVILLDARRRRERDTGPPAPEHRTVGAWSEIVQDMEGLPVLTDHRAICEALEERLIRAGVLPSETTETIQ